MSKATAAFHAWDDEESRYRFFDVGADVPGHVAENVPNVVDDSPVDLVVPAGSLAERYAWVEAGEEQETRSERASAVYAHEKGSGALTDPSVEGFVSFNLQRAVYGPTSAEVAEVMPLASREQVNDVLAQDARPVVVEAAEARLAELDKAEALVAAPAFDPAGEGVTAVQVKEYLAGLDVDTEDGAAEHARVVAAEKAAHNDGKGRASALA